MYARHQEGQASRGLVGQGGKLGEALRADLAINSTKPVPEITLQVERLQQDLGQLGRAISELAGRLAPVRRVPLPATAAGTDSPSPDPIGATQTPMGNQIGEIRRELLSQFADVNTILHELELP